MFYIRIDTPVIPLPKGRARAAFRNRKIIHYTPVKTKDYESIIKQEAFEQMRSSGLSLTEDPICVELNFHMPIPSSYSKAKKNECETNQRKPTTKPDIDNLAKSVLDALNKVVYKDDAQITTLVTKKRYSKEPFLSIIVRTDN